MNKILFLSLFLSFRCCEAQHVILTNAASSNTEYNNFLARHAAVGSVLTQVEKNAHRYLFNALADVSFNGFFEFYTFRGSNIDGLMVKARIGAGNTTALSQPVSNPITYADYSSTAGINGHGIRYLKTGMPNNYITSLGFSFYTPDVVNPVTNPGCPIGAISTGASKCVIEYKSTPGISCTMRGSTLTMNYASLDPGLYNPYSYSSVSTFAILQNGVRTTASSFGGSSTDASEFCIGSADAGLLPWDGNIAFASFDNGRLSETTYASFANIVSNFLWMLGVNTRPLTTPNVSFIVGQSLGHGALATPALSTTQSYNNKMPKDGIYNAANQGSIVPLVEATVESIGSTVANSISYWKRIRNVGSTEHDLIMGNFAVDGAGYATIKKAGSGTAYTKCTAFSENMLNVSKYNYKNKIKIPGILCVHGEEDKNSATYGTDMRQFQVDYDTDLRVLLPEAPTIPIFHTQISSWTKLGFTTCLSPFLLYDEFKTNPTKTILVGAKYFLTHNTDGLHLTNTSERRLGEDYAKALFYLMEYGLYWKPVYPTVINRSSNLIDLTFNLPPLDLTLGSGISTNSLSFDVSNVSDPGNKGFEFYAGTGGNSPTISSVAITSSNSVRVTLSATPTGTGCKIRYGYTGTVDVDAGPTTGARGNLRDNSSTPSLYSNSLYNWCVHFNEDVP